MTTRDIGNIGQYMQSSAEYKAGDEIDYQWDSLNVDSWDIFDYVWYTLVTGTDCLHVGTLHFGKPSDITGL